MSSAIAIAATDLFPPNYGSSSFDQFGNVEIAPPTAVMAAKTLLPAALNGDSAAAKVTAFPISAPVRDRAAVKEAARSAALMTSEAEEIRMQDERGDLLEKHFSEGLSVAEEKRLRYIRWHLHRLDDAREGPAMDRLLEVAVKFEEFNRGVNSLLLELDRIAQEPRHPFQSA
jgi:hypothetical protein